MLHISKANFLWGRIAFRNLLKNSNTRLQHQLAETKNESCEYPQIIDMSTEGQNRHHRQLWYDSIKAIPSVEEKLYELTLRQKETLKKYFIRPVPEIYSGVPFQNYITRTHIEKGLPDNINRMNVAKELSEVQEGLNESLHSHYCHGWKVGPIKQLSDYLEEEEAGSNLANSLINQCFKKLAVKNDYILNSTIQRKPRVESFWWHGGYESEENVFEEQNLCFRYTDFPSFVIRTEDPLPPIVSRDDPLCTTAEVPDYHYHPQCFQHEETTNWLTSAPGYWPGDPYEFPLLVVQTSDKLQKLRNKTKMYDLSKIEDCCGVTSSFGFLNAVATYQGFSPFHDLTYPLVTQTILTNGQDWSFFVYQLNTIAFHNDMDKKDRRNICWSSGKLRLFDTIEDGQIKGINMEVYELLLKFLLNAPYVKEGLVLKPYVGEDRRTEEETKYMRYFLRRMFSQIADHQAHRLEIPTWAQIYKFHKDAPPSPYIKMA